MLIISKGLKFVIKINLFLVPLENLIEIILVRVENLLVLKSLTPQNRFEK